MNATRDALACMFRSVVQPRTVFRNYVDDFIVRVWVDPYLVENVLGVLLDVPGSQRFCDLLDSLVLPAGNRGKTSGMQTRALFMMAYHMRILPLPL